MTRRSPLYDTYKDYPGVKLVDFAGWELPLQFQAGIIAEHMCVRQNAGLFDVSHMGEIELEGEGAGSFVDWLVTNDIGALDVGQAAYTPMCYPEGGVVDDLLVYRRGAARYMFVVNAANRAKVVRWITQENPLTRSGRVHLGQDGVRVTDRSDEIALLALQGPSALPILSELVAGDIAAIKPFHFVEQVRLFGESILLSRTGYTGEDGFEIYCDATSAPAIWKGLIEHGAEAGVLPCGLGARDTLRIEARLPLYGQEISSDISPLEGGLKPFVKFEKGEFCGREKLLELQRSGIPRTLRGIRMIDKGVPRTGYPVWLGDQQVGLVTSGLKSPVLGSFVGLVLASAGILKKGMEVEVDFGPRRKRAEVVATPFYKNTGGKK